MPRTATLLKIVASTAVGAAALYITYTYLVSADTILKTLEEANPTLVLAATACEAAWYAACITGWRQTFTPLTSDPPGHGTLFALYNVKLAVNQAAGPARTVSGDAVRLYYAVQLGYPVTTVTPTIIADLILGNLGYLTVIAIAMTTAAKEIPWEIALINALGFPALGFLWYTLTREELCEEAFEKPLETLLSKLGIEVDLHDLAGSTSKVFRSKSAPKAYLLYTGGWATRVLRLYALTYAVWPNANPLLPAVMSVVIRGSAALAPSPAGLGVVEGITVEAMKTLGAPASTVATILVLDRVYATLIPAIMGGLCLWYLQRRV